MSQSRTTPSDMLVKQSGKNCQALRWDPAAGRLWWVDASGGRVLSWQESAPAVSRLTLYDSVHAVTPCRSGHLLVGLSKRLCLIDPAATPRQRVPRARVVSAVDVFDPRTVISDGHTDRTGNYVFGTRNIAPDQRPIGSFFHYSAAGGLRRLALPTVVGAAGLCFSTEGARLLFGDAAGDTIYQADYDAAQAAVSGVRPFAPCWPGSRLRAALVDAEDGLWTVQESPLASLLVRYRPNGVIDHTLELAPGAAAGLAASGAALGRLVVVSAGGALRTLPHAVCGVADVPFDDRAAPAQLPSAQPGP